MLSTCCFRASLVVFAWLTIPAAALQSEAVESECGVGYVQPGQTKTTPNGVTIQNYGRPGEPAISYWYIPSDGVAPAHLLVEVPTGSHARIKNPKQGDQINVNGHSHVKVVADDFHDSDSPGGAELANGGINIVGDGATLEVQGSNNDVDLKAGTTGNTVNLNGTSNDVDLNYTTGNTVTPTAGQNIHN
jgi:hypothetical protein